LKKIYQDILISIKSDKNPGHFTGRPNCFCVCWQQ